MVFVRADYRALHPRRNPQALTEPRTLVKERLCGPQLDVGARELLAGGHFAAGELRGAEREELQPAAYHRGDDRRLRGLARALDRRQRGHLRGGERQSGTKVEEQGELPHDDDQQEGHHEVGIEPDEHQSRDRLDDEEPRPPGRHRDGAVARHQPVRRHEGGVGHAPIDRPMWRGGEMSRIEERRVGRADGRAHHDRGAGVPEESMSNRELIHGAPVRVCSSLAKGQDAVP